MKIGITSPKIKFCEYFQITNQNHMYVMIGFPKYG